MSPKYFSPQDEGATAGQESLDSEALIVKGLDMFELPSEDGANVVGPSPIGQPAPDVVVDPTAAPEPIVTGATAGTLDDVPGHFRFKNHPAAEKGYLNQRRYVTELESKYATLEQETESLRSKEKREALEAEQEVKENDAFKQFATERNEKLIKDMEDLDPDSDDYHKNVASLQSDVAVDLRGFKYVPEPGSAPPEESDIPTSQPATTAGPITQSQDTSTIDDQPASGDALKYANSVASSLGVNPDDEVYISYAQKAPVSDSQGNPLDFDAQVKWAVDQTRADYLESRLNAADTPGLTKNDPVLMHFIAQAPMVDENKVPITVQDQTVWAIDQTLKYNAEKKTEIIHDSKAPLGKGNRVLPGSAAGADQPLTLEGAINSAAEKRRI